MSHREICIDTETTGLDRKSDRIVEIGCVEINDLMPTGKTYHQYCNPMKDNHREAYKVHGLSNVFLSSKPTFKRIHTTFLRFIEGATLVAHNASFDIGMINEELARLGLEPLQNEVVDTLALAKEKHPKRKHNLDALCKLYHIDISHRTEHGALIDAELLSKVYVELRGGRQFGMSLEMIEADEYQAPVIPKRPVPLASRVTDKEKADHAAFIKTLGKDAIWRNYV